MANYVFLMQFFNESSLPYADELRLITISQIGSGVSIVSCVMILGLLCALPVSGDGLFIIGNMCVVMIAAQLSFIGAENTSYPSPTMCKIATGLLQYFFLAVHFSSLAYGVHLMTKLQSMVINKTRKHWRYVLIIWMVPLGIVSITATLRGDTYAREKLCWLSVEHSTRLAFLLPMSVILLVNFGLYLLIILTRVILDIKKTHTKMTTLRHVVVTSLTMFPTLSLTWMFGYAVTFDNAVAMQYIYVLLNSAQGMLLLIFHVLPNSQVNGALCRKIKEGAASSSDSDPRSTGPFTIYSAAH